ncbi:peptidylprolyl isomerase [Undibacterium cyanobacteriorum]|uniref:peptidylprolyl isomerase n=1 Tax=Undibacterium cyanobacteriorum TaxID=3073561 RepID=A0ABY9RIJ3_9BURK|nr:peptidylprolyl isomerase [Undibacterium sp. 20NA77.5]WMW81048.1 peptidylprolyl isomerase [Undibacterium sp. 20NA77.5]
MLMKSRVVIGGAIAVLALTACNKGGEKAEGVESVVAATVNGQPISKKQVDLIVKQQAGQGMPDTPEVRKMIIDSLALEHLAAQEALKKGLDKKGETADQIEMAKMSILAQGFVEDYKKSNPVTDKMLEEEYAKIKEKIAGTEYLARHILVDKEDDAKAIIASLKKDPKQFAAIAKAKSKDPGSKDRGGDLGWFDPRGMVKEFSDATAKLEKGKFTEEPVKSQFGYHVIFLEDSRSKPVPTLEQIKPRLVQQVENENVRKLLDDMKAKAKIEVVGASAASASASAPAMSITPAPASAADKH